MQLKIFFQTNNFDFKLSQSFYHMRKAKLDQPISSHTNLYKYLKLTDAKFLTKRLKFIFKLKTQVVKTQKT